MIDFANVCGFEVFTIEFNPAFEFVLNLYPVERWY